MPHSPVVRRAALFALLTGGLACQTYDFEPVAPLSVRQTATAVDVQATPNKPNLMLLVDKSGSMDQPIDASDPDCHVGGINGPLCGDPAKQNLCTTAVCPTRWSELSSAITAFLQAQPLVGRYGLTLFPEPESAQGGCAPTTHSTAPIPPGASGDDDSVLQAAAAAARTSLAAVTSGTTGSIPGPTITGGGTPTSGSLAYLLTRETVLQDSSRENIVLLLTDGLPNCDAALNNLAGTAACQCTFGPLPEDCPTDTTPFPGAGCLDADKAVEVIQLMGSAKIQTFVIGFGADTGAASARDTLQRMAVAGAIKHPRACPGVPPNQPCAADNPCDLSTGLCTKQYYQATDAASLGDVLESISEVLDAVCERPLTEIPDDPALLSVTVDGRPYLQSPTTWTYVPPTGLTPKGKPGPAVVFVDGQPLCNMLKASTAQNPVKVEIRILKVL
jgi:hypothetical protein